MSAAIADRVCRICSCTDSDCRQCIERTGKACYWYEDDLCSACLGRVVPVDVLCKFADASGNNHYLTFTIDINAGMDEDIQISDAYRIALRHKGFFNYTIKRVEYDLHEMD